MDNKQESALTSSSSNVQGNSEQARAGLITGVLKIEQASTKDGTLIGLRLTLPACDRTLLVFADQQAVPGFRIGEEFSANIDERIIYTPYMAMPVANSGNQMIEGSAAQKSFWAGFEASTLGLFGTNIRAAWNKYMASEEFLQRHKRESSPSCTWTRDEDTGTYDTGCGRTWSLTDGGHPEEHGQYYCHHCGKPIIEAEASHD